MTLSEKNEQMSKAIDKSDKFSNAQKVRIQHTIKDGDKAVKNFESHLNGETPPQDVGGVAGERLRSFIERVERLEEEKAALAEDIKECYAEAKGVGFDAKTMKKIIKLRKMNSEKRSEEAQLLNLYASAIGMQHVLL